MRKKMTLGRRVKKLFQTTGPLYIVLFLILTVYVLFIFYLLFWGIITSIKDVGEFNDNVLGLPHSVTFANFIKIYKNFYVRVNVNGVLEPRFVEDMLLNTVMYAGVGSLITALVPCIVAYAATRFDFKFNAVLRGIVIVTMILPIIGSAPAAIKLLRDLGLFDSLVGNWIQRFSFLGMNFLIYSAAFEVLPKDFDDAAYIDGASELQLLTRVLFPMISPVFGTILLISFIGSWNDYQTAMLYLPSHPTLAFGVYELSRTQINELNNVPARMAGCVILLVPVLILFLIFKNKLMGNITLGGVKE